MNKETEYLQCYAGTMRRNRDFSFTGKWFVNENNMLFLETTYWESSYYEPTLKERLLSSFFGKSYPMHVDTQCTKFVSEHTFGYVTEYEYEIHDCSGARANEKE